MNISFVIGSLRGGGAERVILNLAEKFVEAGHKTSILTITDNLCDYEVPEGVNTFFVKPPFSIRGLRLVSRMVALRNMSHRLENDVVISFAGANVFVAFAFLGAKEKVILSERNDPQILPKGRMARKIRNISYKFADALVFQTNDAMKYFSYIDKTKKVIIKNPIGNNIPSNGNRVNECFINVGRLSEQKNQKLLIDAFAIVSQKYHDVRLKIYGKGPLETYLKHYIESKGLTDRVTLSGHSKILLEEIKNDRYFVLSSDYEGMSNALLEAMALNMTVISTDHPIGGAREVISNGENGILVPVKDVDALSEAMIMCLSDPEMADRMAISARYVKDELSLEKITRKWLDLMGELFNVQ